MPDEAAVLKGSGTSEQQAYQEFYGRVPRSVEVELTEELVDCCVPGEGTMRAMLCVRLVYSSTRVEATAHTLRSCTPVDCCTPSTQ